MSKELQKDDITLPGGLGEVKIASTSQTHEIKKAVTNSQDGSATLTLMKGLHYYLGIEDEPKTEDADFEIIEPKQLKQ